MLASAVAASLTAAAADGIRAQAAVGGCTASSDWGTVRVDLGAEVIELVNRHRAAHGLTALHANDSLTRTAVWKARHMAAYGYMTHNDPAPPVGRTAQERFRACGYPAETALWGENIAFGYATPEAVMEQWLASPGHRANIESTKHRALGVAVAAASDGTLYWAQAFGAIAQAATSSSTPPASGPAPTPPSQVAPRSAGRPAVASAGSTRATVRRVGVTPRRVRAAATVTMTLGLAAPAPAGARLRCRARAGRTPVRLVSRRLASKPGPAAVCTWRLTSRMAGRLLRATATLTTREATTAHHVTRWIGPARPPR